MIPKQILVCNTETLNGHFKDDTAAPIMHEKVVKGERLKQKLCYIVKSQIKQNLNVSCFAVFKLLNRSPRSRSIFMLLALLEEL